MTTNPPTRRPARSAAALLAGFVLIVALSTVTDLALHGTGVFPPEGQAMANGLWALATVYRVAFGIAGCWLAARLAPERPMWHAMALGWVGVALSTFGTVATWNMGPEFGPKWYPIGLVLTALPSAWVGGKLHRPRSA